MFSNECQLYLKNAELPQARTVTHHHCSNTLFNLGWIHNNRWNEIEKDVIAVSAPTVWMRESYFQLVHGFQQQSFT
jgi:hypothetical protein